jgi:UDP-glucose 4-epimerase
VKPACFLIIGSTGLIGQNLRKSLNKNDVFTISREAGKGHIDENHHFLDVSKKNLFQQLVRELELKYKKINVFFLAGESSVGNSLENPKKTFLKSVKSFINVIDTLKNVNSTIVVASSGSVYDSRFKNFFHERDDLYPPSPYSASKYTFEGLSLAFFESFNLDIRIARIFSVYGEGMKRFFIYDLIQKFLKSNKEVILSGTGKQVRDFLHVEQVTEALKIILENGKSGEIYNVCSGEPTNLDFLAKKIRALLGKEQVNIVWDGKPNKGTRDFWYGDNSKIKSIGYSPTRMDNFLKRTVDSFRLDS